MKKRFSIIFALILLGSPYSYGAPESEVQPSTQTVQNAKIKIIFISQPGCRSCEKVKEHMQYGPIKKLLNENFVVEYKDISEASTLPAALEQPIGTPTLYFLDENGNQIIEPMVGGKSEEGFTDTLNKAIASNQKKAEEK